MAYDRGQPYQSTSPWGRSKRRNPRDGAHKRGLNTKLHVAVDGHGMPVRVFIQKVPSLMALKVVGL